MFLRYSFEFDNLNNLVKFLSLQEKYSEKNFIVREEKLQKDFRKMRRDVWLLKLDSFCYFKQINFFEDGISNLETNLK